MLVVACCVRRRTGVRWSLPVRLIPWWAEKMRKIRMNWKECAVVETVPGKVSGAPVIKGSRVRPEDLIVNRAEGEAWPTYAPVIRHYTLSAGDLAIVHRCRGEHNRLGRALMLCYLRYPGRPLKAGERPPAELTAFVAEQIDALPTAMEAYLAAEQNRQRHAVECQERLRLRPFGKHGGAR